jgi:MFS family permease
MTLRFALSGAPAFRHRNYRLFFGGQAISLVGTWMQQVAQAWLVLQLTRDPIWLGLVAAAQFAPVIVFGLFGGVLADQLPKRQTLIATQTVSMILAFILFGLTATGVVHVWHVMILAALLGLTNAIDMPTRQAFAVEMVGRDSVTNAVGLNAALFNGSRVLGPAAAGLLIGSINISAAFLINGLSYLGAIGAYLAMRETELRPTERPARPHGLRGVVTNLAEGARYVRTTPLVLLSCAVVGLAATFGMNFNVLVPPLADTELRVGASGFGFLMAASGIGSVVAALSVAFAQRIRPMWMAVGSVALGIGGLALAWSPSYGLSMVAMLVAGAGGIGMAVTANTTIQTHVPDHLRGRVMSVYTTLFAGSVPVGGLLAGWVASTWGVRAAFGVGGLLTLAVGVGAWAWVGRVRAGRRLERRAPSPMAAGSAGESPIAAARRR